MFIISYYACFSSRSICDIHTKTNNKFAKAIFRIYSPGTYIVILEPISLTTLEIQLGEHALVSESRFSIVQCLGFLNLP